MKCAGDEMFVRSCLSVFSTGGLFDTTEDIDDGEESKEETMENENVDAVVDTRGVEMDIENAGEEKGIGENNEEE